MNGQELTPVYAASRWRLVAWRAKEQSSSASRELEWVSLATINTRHLVHRLLCSSRQSARISFGDIPVLSAEGIGYQALPTVSVASTPNQQGSEIFGDLRGPMAVPARSRPSLQPDSPDR